MKYWPLSFTICAVVLGVSLALASSAPTGTQPPLGAGAPTPAPPISKTAAGVSGAAAEKPVASPGGAAPASPDTKNAKALPAVSQPAVALTAQEQRNLRYEFQRAQAGERRALEHRNRTELKELKASQEARLKEWLAKESEARKVYFKSHAGAEKREYMRDLNARRKSLIQILSDEKSLRAREQDVRFKSLLEDQKNKATEFQGFIQKANQPPKNLWPSGSP